MSMNVKVGNSLGNIASKLFRTVQGVVYDLQSGSIALKNPDGSVSVLDRKVVEGDKRVFELVNKEFNVTMSIPAFAFHTDVAKVKKGDLVVSDRGVLGFIIETSEQAGVANTAYTILRPNGEIGTSVIPTSTIFGKEGIMVVQSLGFDGKGKVDPLMLMALSGDGNIDPMMFLLMNKDGASGSGIDPMMMMLMMNGNNGAGGAGGINPLMFMLMNKDGADGIDPMMLMLMMNGGNLGGSPNQNGNTWST